MKRPNIFFAYLAFLIVLSISFASSENSNREKLLHLNPNLSIEERVKDFLSRMTIEEKNAQLQCQIREVEGKNIITNKDIGNLGDILRSLGPREGAEKENRIQKLAVEKTRLGIPIIIHDEALHGICCKGGTSFPQAIGLAAPWDTKLVVEQ